MNRKIASAALVAAFVNAGCAGSPTAPSVIGAAPPTAVAFSADAAASRDDAAARLKLLNTPANCETTSSTGTLGGGDTTLTGTGVTGTGTATTQVT